jgi:hypothetical protein
MLDRQAQFRLAADTVTAELVGLPEGDNVALIGSVARPLWREVPRFAPFRQLGIPIWHECKDVDLAVWLDGLGSLRMLNRARSLAVQRLWRRKSTWLTIRSTSSSYRPQATTISVGSARSRNTAKAR